MSVYRHTARIVFTREEAEYLRSVLGPEVEREVPKCRVRWSMTAGEGAMCVEAEDLGALRAAMNSYIRWTHLALDVRKSAAGKSRESPRSDTDE